MCLGIAHECVCLCSRCAWPSLCAVGDDRHEPPTVANRFTNEMHAHNEGQCQCSLAPNAPGGQWCNAGMLHSCEIHKALPASKWGRGAHWCVLVWEDGHRLCTRDSCVYKFKRRLAHTPLGVVTTSSTSRDACTVRWYYAPSRSLQCSINVPRTEQRWHGLLSTVCHSSESPADGDSAQHSFARHTTFECVCVQRWL